MWSFWRGLSSPGHSASWSSGRCGPCFPAARAGFPWYRGDGGEGVPDPVGADPAEDAGGSGESFHDAGYLGHRPDLSRASREARCEVAGTLDRCDAGRAEVRVQHFDTAPDRMALARLQPLRVTIKIRVIPSSVRILRLSPRERYRPGDRWPAAARPVPGTVAGPRRSRRRRRTRTGPRACAPSRQERVCGDWWRPRGVRGRHRYGRGPPRAGQALPVV